MKIINLLINDTHSSVYLCKELYYVNMQKLAIPVWMEYYMDKAEVIYYKIFKFNEFLALKQSALVFLSWKEIAIKSSRSSIELILKPSDFFLPDSVQL